MNEVELLNEKIRVSKHRKTPTQMALQQRKTLLDCGCAIKNHDTPANGNHNITYLTDKKKLRVCEISCTNKGRNRTQMKDRPATADEKKRYGVLP